LENPIAKPHPKQDPLEAVMHVSPFTSFEPALFEGVEPSAPKEDDLECFCENERPSSPSIKFEPFHADPFVVFNHDQESTSVLHGDSLEMENSWATGI
jgi:hypothetical protein